MWELHPLVRYGLNVWPCSGYDWMEICSIRERRGPIRRIFTILLLIQMRWKMRTGWESGKIENSPVLSPRDSRILAAVVGTLICSLWRGQFMFEQLRERSG